VGDQGVRALVVAVYFGIVLAIGAAAYRRTGSSSEEYFLGGRTARTVVLFMALFGTNVTPFVLMGIPGLSYHLGVGVFGLNAAIIVLGIPLTIWLIGLPAWRAARRLGVVSPAELYAERFGSPALGVVLFVVFFVYTVPYMVTAVAGVGIAVSVLTEDAVAFEAAAAGILVLTIVYTSAGGMRATMWTNVFQGSVFLGFTLLAFMVVAGDEGGLVALTERVAAERPELLVKPDHPRFAPGAWSSWGLAISLTVIAFPHMLVRIFAAADERALKNACRYYPLAMILLWVPAVMFGVWGAVLDPGLAGKASDAIFPRLVHDHMGPALQGLALAGILAAVMSSLDAMMLTLSSMLGRDVLRRFRPETGDRTEVMVGRGFIVVLAAVTYAIVLARPASIFDVAKLAFFGYCTVVPTLYLSLRWRRYTAEGAIAGIVTGNVAMLAAVAGWLPSLGVLPVAWGLGSAIVVGVGVSMASPPPNAERTERALGPVPVRLTSP
jgi:SSS family solute:Na+ symporter